MSANGLFPCSPIERMVMDARRDDMLYRDPTDVRKLLLKSLPRSVTCLKNSNQNALVSTAQRKNLDIKFPCIRVFRHRNDVVERKEFCFRINQRTGCACK